MTATIDFGASATFGAHHFYVEVPVQPRAAIQIYEDFGFDGEGVQREAIERRVVLARELWTQIRDEVRRDFNARLKKADQNTGSWHTGRVHLDRFLGRELCVLAWAAEHSAPEECAVICAKWGALRPEERWWLYTKTAAEAGLASDTQRGWRKALYCALSDGEGIRVAPQVRAQPKKSKVKAEQTLDFFDLLGGVP